MATEDLVAQVAGMILKARCAVAFTGAGVSTESGIPDFRSAGGIWEKYNIEDFTYERFLTSRRARALTWKLFMEEAFWKARPNTAHCALAELERMGALDCIITQNIDSLHQQAGNSPEKVIELHGTARWVKCLDCGARFPSEEIYNLIRKENLEIPDCTRCGGMLKQAVISFGEPMPEPETSEAERRARHCDLFMVVGSSLVVFPAANMPLLAARSGARLVIINTEPTSQDALADVVIQAKAGEVLPEIVRQIKEGLERGAGRAGDVPRT